jgi:hypothetical protein
VLEFVPQRFEIVQRKTFVPKPKLVTVVEGLLTLVIIPDPVISDHVPTPVVTFPASVVDGEEMQMVWFGPAIEAEGRLSTSMVVIAVLVAHTPLVTLHRKMFVPTAKPVTALVGLLTPAMLPVPDIKDQVPIPGVVILPVNKVVGVLMHNV